MIDLREKKAGDLIEHEEWNTLVAEVRRLGKFEAAAPLEVHNGSGGIGISLMDAPPESCVVRLDDTCAGGGKYEGVIMNPPASLACSGADLNMPEGLDEGDPCIISNVAEDGQSTHQLAAGKFHNGLIMGQAADGTWLVNIEVGAGECSPGTASFQSVTNTAYGGGIFSQTITTYNVDFCLGTIDAGTVATTTVFSTQSCDTEPTSAGEFYSY